MQQPVRQSLKSGIADCACELRAEFSVSPRQRCWGLICCERNKRAADKFLKAFKRIVPEHSRVRREVKKMLRIF